MPNDPVTCRRCGAAVAIRINRNGFFQKKILARLGFYPWKCGACGSVFYFKRRSSHSHDVGFSSAPEPNRPSHTRY